MKPITKEWLNKAEDDIAAIECLIKNEHLTNVVAFHAQQSVEKCLKAVIEEHEVEFIKTHNLETLYGRIKPIIDIKVELNVLKMLNGIYVSARYPGDLGLIPYGNPTLEDAHRFYTFAKEIFIAVSHYLKKRSTKQ